MDQSLDLHPGDAVTRYRHARILEAQRDIVTAIGVLETVIGDRTNTPPTIYANACVDAARLYETTGNVAHAIELYRSARTVHGADEQTKTRADRALARLATADPSR
jgi:predicted Zn-dependent protease